MRSERRASACCKKNIRPSAALVKQLYKESQAAFFCLAFVVCYGCLLYIRIPCNKYALDSLGKMG